MLFGGDFQQPHHPDHAVTVLPPSDIGQGEARSWSEPPLSTAERSPTTLSGRVTRLLFLSGSSHSHGERALSSNQRMRSLGIAYEHLSATLRSIDAQISAPLVDVALVLHQCDQLWVETASWIANPMASVVLWERDRAAVVESVDQLLDEVERACVGKDGNVPTVPVCLDAKTQRAVRELVGATMECLEDLHRRRSENRWRRFEVVLQRLAFTADRAVDSFVQLLSSIGAMHLLAAALLASRVWRQWGTIVAGCLPLVVADVALALTLTRDSNSTKTYVSSGLGLASVLPVVVLFSATGGTPTELTVALAYLQFVLLVCWSAIDSVAFAAASMLVFEVLQTTLLLVAVPEVSRPDAAYTLLLSAFPPLAFMLAAAHPAHLRAFPRRPLGILHRASNRTQRFDSISQRVVRVQPDHQRATSAPAAAASVIAAIGSTTTTSDVLSSPSLQPTAAPALSFGPQQTLDGHTAAMDSLVATIHAEGGKHSASLSLAQLEAVVHRSLAVVSVPGAVLIDFNESLAELLGIPMGIMEHRSLFEFFKGKGDTSRGRRLGPTPSDTATDPSTSLPSESLFPSPSGTGLAGTYSLRNKPRTWVHVDVLYEVADYAVIVMTPEVGAIDVSWAAAALQEPLARLLHSPSRPLDLLGWDSQSIRALSMIHRYSERIATAGRRAPVASVNLAKIIELTIPHGKRRARLLEQLNEFAVRVMVENASLTHFLSTLVVLLARHDDKPRLQLHRNCVSVELRQPIRSIPLGAALAAALTSPSTSRAAVEPHRRNEASCEASESAECDVYEAGRAVPNPLAAPADEPDGPLSLDVGDSGDIKAKVQQLVEHAERGNFIIDVEVDELNHAHTLRIEMPVVTRRQLMREPTGLSVPFNPTVLVVEPDIVTQTAIARYFWELGVSVRPIHNLDSLARDKVHYYSGVVLPVSHFLNSGAIERRDLVATFPHATIIASTEDAICRRHGFHSISKTIDHFLNLKDVYMGKINERLISEVRYRGQLTICQQMPSSVTDAEFMNYHNLGLLGSGGQGNVYHAIIKGETHLAVKETRIEPNDSKIFRREKEKERDRARCLVYVHKVLLDRDHQRVLTFMELCTTFTLRERLRYGGVSAAEAARLNRDILCGLQEIHNTHKWAGDVKGANLLFDRFGRLKHIDFLSSAHTRAWDAPERGTAEDFESPEQKIMFLQRADIWAVGAVQLELMHGGGYVPFGPRTSLNRAHEYAGLRELGRTYIERHLLPQSCECITDEWIAFTARCLTYDAARRPTVAELLGDPFIREGPLVEQHRPATPPPPEPKGSPFTTATASNIGQMTSVGWSNDHGGSIAWDGPLSAPLSRR